MALVTVYHPHSPGAFEEISDADLAAWLAVGWLTEPPPGWPGGSAPDPEWPTVEEVVETILTDPDSAARQSLAGEFVQTDQVGAASGVASLDSDSKVPVAQVPSLPASKITSGTVDDARLPSRLSDAELSSAYASISVETAVAVTEGADPSGVTASHAALQAGLDAAPSGSIYKIPPGSYWLTGGLALTDKSLTIDATGATFVKTTAGSIFVAKATNDTIHNVSALTATTITEESTLPGVTITLASGSTNPGYKRGDVVKVVSDDVIPGDRPGDGTVEPRLGQYFTVESCAAGTITVYGTVYDPMTTNVRVMRMKDEHKVRVFGGNWNLTSTSDAVQFTNLVGPEFKGGKVSATNSSGVTVWGCIEHDIDVTVTYAPCDPATNKFGYGVNSISSAYGKVWVNARRARHAYTTNTNQRAVGSTDIYAYGRTFRDVVQGIARDCASAGFDTHANAAEVVFINTHVYGARAGWGLRGRNNKVLRSTGSNLGVLFWVFSHDGVADSWGHEIDGLSVTGTTSENLVMQFNLNSVSGVRESRPTRVRNVYMTGISGDVIEAVNATIEVENVVGVGAATIGDNSAMLRLTNSDVYGSGVRWDLRSNTAGADLRYCNISGTSILRLAGFNEWRFTDGNTRMHSIVNRNTGATETVQVSGLELDFLPQGRVKGSTPTDRLSSTTSYLEWKIRKPQSGGISEEFNFGSTDVTDATKLSIFAYSRAMAMAMTVTMSSAATLGTMPSGRFRGQSLSIVSLNASTADLTIPNDTAKKIVTNSGSSITLSANKAVRFVWNGTYWCQSV